MAGRKAATIASVVAMLLLLVFLDEGDFSMGDGWMGALRWL